jgi:hypothetical protein
MRGPFRGFLRSSRSRSPRHTTAGDDRAPAAGCHGVSGRGPYGSTRRMPRVSPRAALRRRPIGLTLSTTHRRVTRVRRTASRRAILDCKPRPAAFARLLGPSRPLPGSMIVAPGPTARLCAVRRRSGMVIKLRDTTACGESAPLTPRTVARRVGRPGRACIALKRSGVSATWRGSPMGCSIQGYHVPKDARGHGRRL